MSKIKSKNDFNSGKIDSAQPTGDSHDLELLGLEGFDKCPAYYRKWSESGEFDDILIRDSMRPGLRFYYRLAQYISEAGNHYPTPDFMETGVGFIEKRKKKVFFIRETPLFSGEDKDHLTPRDPNLPPNSLPVGFPAIINSVIPTHYYQALSSPHCVITSTEAFSPTPVELEENSLLGRKDNRVQSIDKDELREILTDEHICDAVKKNHKQMALSSRRVNLTKENAVISAPILRTFPFYKDNEKPKAQKGAIIFNESSNCLEYFTGEEWRTLMWRENE
tara:strand:+ start:1690 stop:2523 length:834 start_codon:yes stop_codon:yes gene_type:complete